MQRPLPARRRSRKEQQREGAIASGPGLGQTWLRSLRLQKAHCPVREIPHVAPLVQEMAEYDQDWKSSAGEVLGEGRGRRRDFRLEAGEDMES